MTDLTMADNALVDDGINADAPVTVAPPAPEAPAEPKVWSAERFQQRLQERLKSKDEAVAREVFDADAGNEIKAVKLARKYGLHPSVVTPNLNEYEIRDLAERFGAAPPKVRNFLGSDRVNAMLGYQDIENLGVIERVAQNLFEFGKGTPEGVGTLAGSALKGFGALIETASPELRPYLSELAQLDKGNAAAVADLRRRADVGLGGKDRFSFHSAMSDVLEGADTGANLQRQMVPKVTDTWGYQAGQAIQRDANIFPARPGFEDSTGRALGSGFGTLLAGAAISALTGPIGGTLAFGASGAGEAVDNAVRAGATDTDIVSAARLGIIPGLTDSVPIETLLGRIPVPGGRIVKLAVGELGPALRAIGRIGWQAAIEGIQEGGQAFLQNLIAREVYKPEQSLTEGLPGDAGIGAGVGGIAATAKEIAMLVAGRRARGGHPFHAAKEIDQETRQAETAQAQAQNLADVIERVQSSPLTQNDPERMKALLGEIAGQDGAVYMPATEVARLYQEGKINDAVLNQWGVLDQVAEVRRTGGDLVIPAASFMTSEMAKEAVAEVTQSVRMSASAMTARESEAFLSERQARIDDLIERMSVANEARPDGAFIFDTIQNAVIAAGRSAAEAKAYAALTAERYIRRAADRADTSPDSLFVKDNFRVLGPGMEAGVRAIVRDEMDVVIARLLSGREVKTPKTPVLDLLKKRGGVQPGSPLAKDLAGMGITPKTNRGLFLPSGMAAADNIVASEDTILTDNGIAVDANGYAQPDALMDAIREEIAGRPWQTQAEKDRIARLDAPVAELEKVMGAAGFDWRNASPEAIRAFLETALSPEPVIAGAAETVLAQPFGGSETASTPLGDAETVNVDGVERPALNSDGKPIHWSVEGVRNFWRWFGDSKVVDGAGRPVAVYHGTDRKFSKFNTKKTTQGIIWFTSDRSAIDAGNVGAAGRGVVMELYAKVESPADWKQYDQLLLAEFKGRGLDGAILRDDDKRFDGFVFKPEQMKSATGNRGTFDPNDARILYQPDGSGFKRGSFERQTDPYGDIVNIIRLTKNADRSTFLHESGHFWLFQLIEDSYDPAVRDDARVRLQADLQTTLDLFGLKIDVKASNPDAILSQITTDMHETWARMTESYFMEGKAPSKELRSLFAKFSGWLISIYRKLRALNVDLTDDVRGVFDRLLATEDAIAEARDHRMYAVPADLAESLTAAEKANIEKLAEQAVLEARMDLQGRVARDIEREKADEWKAEKKAVKETIRLAVRRQPMYAAVNLLKSGANAEGDQIVNEDGSPRQFKLDRKEAIERYGEEIVGLMPGGIWAKKGDPSISMDVMASLAGFDSADSLKLGLMTAKGMPEKAAIAAEVDAEMKRRHGDLMANIAEEAADAVANDKQMELMALQARYIRRIAGDKMRQAATRQGTREGAAPLSEAREAVTDASTMVDAVERSGAPAEAVASAQVGEELARVAQSAQAPMRAAQGAAVATVKRLPPVAYDVGVIKEAATQFVLGKKVRDLGTPERYEQQASRLTRDIEKAIAGRDYNRAQYLMEQRLFNLQLAREVRKAGTQIERTREYLDKFNGRKVREAMGKAGADYLERIDGLLEQYEFRRASNRDLDRRKALQEWLAAQEEAGLAPVVPPAVLERSQMVNYRSVSYGELMDLRDAVKSIEHVAQFKNKLLANKQKRELQAVVEEAVANIQASIPPLPPNVNPQRDNFKSKWNATVVSGLALVTKARTYFVAMDGVEAGGLLDRLILTPIRNGEVRVSRRKDIEGRRFKTLIERHYGKGALKWGSPKTAVFIPEINASLTLEERLAVALNWGNESNRQAILDDEKRGWDQSGVQAILDTLEKRDWDFVQGTWDYINTFWPEVAETQRQRTGLPPEKVEAAKVQTKFGEYAGGYYPLKYDPEMSPRTAENDINSEFKAMNAGRYAAAATKRGHTKERVGSGKQSPMLSLNVIPQHVNQVLTDVELGPAISDAWKILQHKDMKAAISGHMGVEVTRQLDVWVKDVAAGSIHAGDRLSKMLRGLRTSVSAGAMGFKLSTTLIQVTGFTQTAVRVGYAHTLLGMAKFVANPMKASREVRAMSPFMDIRTRTFQRDVADALTQARGVGGIKGNVLASLFWPIAKMQQMVDTPTWLAGYDRAVKEGKTGDDAIAFADAMVESSQSSSLMSNLSPVERGTVSQGTRLSEFVKLWTTFYSFFNAKLNLAMQRTQATDFRRPGQVAELAADYLMLFWVEAALGDLMLRQLPDAISGDDKDDDEKTLMTGIWHQVALTFYSMTGTLPLLREAAGAMQGFDAGPGSSRALGDLGKGAAQVVKAGRAALSEDEDVNGWQLIRALIAAGNVVSPIKYPAAQINTAVRAMEKSAKDKDVSMIDYLISRPK